MKRLTVTIKVFAAFFMTLIFAACTNNNSNLATKSDIDSLRKQIDHLSSGSSASELIKVGKTENPHLDPLTPQNSILILIDYQPNMIDGVGSGDRTLIINSAVASAKTAQILGIPVVYTSISPKVDGEFIKQLTDIFPKLEVIARSVPTIDALEDPGVMNAIKSSGRKKVIVSGLWTSMCFAFSAIHAKREGFDVYGIMDATGDATVAAHEHGVERMIQAGVVPITWMSLTFEWMHDWANPKSKELKTEVLNKYDVVFTVLP